MIDINTFLLMLLCILGSILLIVLIILGIKMINIVNRFNGVLNELDVKLNKFDKAFQIVDIFTDNLALISDKIVDLISSTIRKMLTKKKKRKEEEINEQ